MAGEFAGTARFQVLRTLGEGGMGVVYEALDRERAERVALKTLRAFSAEALLRFKGEFRSLQALDHPNLVHLGELIEDGGQWFFTMELVAGSTFVEYVRGNDPRVRDALSPSLASLDGPPPPRAPLAPDLAPTASADDLTMAELVDDAHQLAHGELDELKLRVALAQLAEGLGALHRAGKVHRDIKPSNILVTREGRVVILDFGLVAEVDDSVERRVVGTVDYMAPEQAVGTAPGASADWYSVGAVVYEALTGRPPFVGPSMQVLMGKQRRDPPSPRALVPSVPKYLDELCLALLQRDPALRPRERAILRRLGIGDPTPMPERAVEREVFVGRRAALDALHAAFAASRAAPVTLAVHGEAGVGKSALVRRFADELAERAPDAVVLSGRCQERETVPFRAFDGVVDSLSRVLARSDKALVAALLPPDTPSLAHVFPVLSRIEAVAQQPPPVGLDAAAVRARAYAALRELLTRLAARGPVVVVIDDFQWADADSLALRREVLRPDGAALLTVFTLRPREAMGDERTLLLPRLDAAEAEALATALLARGGLHDPAWAAEIAAEGQGHPLFIDQLVRHAVEAGRPARAVRLEEAIWRRIRRLDEPLRRLMELLAVAPGPLAQDAAAAAAGLEFADFARLSTVLRAANLVRTSGSRRADFIEPYHAEVRRAVLQHLPPDEAARIATFLPP